MTNQEFMNEMQQLVIDGFRQIMKQGVAFTILLAVSGGMGWLLYDSKAECKGLVAEMKIEVEDLKASVKMCDDQREELKVEVAALRTRLDFITVKKR